MTPDSLETDLREVERVLLDALHDLFPPLSSVARAHVREAQPFLRAAAVITAANALEAGSPAQPHGRTLHDQAMLLGSALEMLAVALSVHRLLLLPEDTPADAPEDPIFGDAQASGRIDDDTLDKALVGSTILAGDYCFSRAASMAAQTESARVVDLFSMALQQVSEVSLRSLFAHTAPDQTGHNPAPPNSDLPETDAAPHLEDIILATAGVEAICALAAVDAATTEASIAFARAVAARAFARAAEQLSSLPTPHAPWQTLLAWARANQPAAVPA